MGWTPGTETWPKMIDTPVELWPSVKEYNPYQKEIEYFWPLTEQIPLELDYSECDTTYSHCTIKSSCGTIAISNGGSWTTTALSVSADKIQAAVGIDTPGLTMQVKKKPNIIKRALYKLLDINWRIV